MTPSTPRDSASASQMMFIDPRHRIGITRTHGFQVAPLAAAASSAGTASFSHIRARMRGFSSYSSGTSTALIMVETMSTE